MMRSGTWSAPGRVNLIGEHTDYNGGASLPFAINRRTRIEMRIRGDDLVRAQSTFDNIVYEARISSSEPLRGWASYVIGTARIMAQHYGAGPGVDVRIDSDIPVGVGVSSSHALECAMGLGLSDLWGLDADRHDLITLTQRVEHEIVGAPTGTMDQSAILLAMADHGVFLDFGRGTAETVALGFERAGLAVLVMDSTQRHSHATGGYGQRRAQCEEAARIAGVEMLGQIAPDEVEGWHTRMPDEVFRRMRHVVTDTQRTLRIAELLRAGKPREIGPLLCEGHVSERDDFEISTPAINAAVDAALGAGALGARLTGGGFGGASIALVDRDDADRIADEVSRTVEAAGFPRPVIFAVTPDDGARRDS